MPSSVLSSVKYLHHDIVRWDLKYLASPFFLNCQISMRPLDGTSGLSRLANLRSRSSFPRSSLPKCPACLAALAIPHPHVALKSYLACPLILSPFLQMSLTNSPVGLSARFTVPTFRAGNQ
jgi:hypothetical protein